MSGEGPAIAQGERSDGNDLLLETSDASLLEMVDHLLNQGVVLTGDVVLGLAGVDLIYLRLSAVLCAADRLLPGARGPAAPISQGGVSPGH